MLQPRIPFGARWCIMTGLNAQCAKDIEEALRVIPRMSLLRTCRSCPPSFGWNVSSWACSLTIAKQR